MAGAQCLQSTLGNQLRSGFWNPFTPRSSHQSEAYESFSAILLYTAGRVLARISKMLVQNSNFKNFARPDLATYLLQILIPATFNSLVCQKRQFTLQLCSRRWFVRNIFVNYPPKIKNLHRIFCLSIQEVFMKLPV